MVEKFDRTTFERVFSDCQVIDVDFSEWDKRIVLWTLADHYENWNTRCPVVVVEFEAVREFVCQLPAADLELESPDAHLQWNIHDFEVQENRHSIRAHLFGLESSPILRIECALITFRKSSAELLDSTFPRWNRPYAGLARPGIERLAAFKAE